MQINIWISGDDDDDDNGNDDVDDDDVIIDSKIMLHNVHIAYFVCNVFVFE